HLEAGRRIQAIDELHNTKTYWFTGETIEGSILAMLLLSDCYQKLGMHLAARYYAAAALFAGMSDTERAGRFVGRAAFQLSETYYVSGEWISYNHVVALALLAHRQHAMDPDDWTKHSDVSRAIAHALIARAIAHQIAPELLPLLDDGMLQWRL